MDQKCQSEIFSTLTDKPNLWVTVGMSTLVFSGGAQSFVLLRANMDYSGANLHMKEDSQLKIYRLVSL